MSKTILNQTDRVVDNTEYFVLATTGANWRSKNDSTGVFSSVPIIIGGSAAGSTVTIESTSGAGTSDAIIFKTGSQAEAMRIDTSGHVILGGTTNDSSTMLQLISAGSPSATPARANLIYYSASNFVPIINFQFSNSNTLGTQTAVTSGSTFGILDFDGSNGTSFKTAARISGVADATFTSTSTPGRLSFSTVASGTTTPLVEQMRIDNAGLLTLFAGQIAFPATANPSANVNTLDDYEEGTWTPSVGGTATYTTQTGTYTKIGRLVFVHMDLKINAIGTGSTFIVSGLPFAAVGNHALAASLWSASATSAVSIGPYIQNGGTSIRISGIAVSGASQTDITFFQAATALYVCGCYEAAT